MPDLTTGVEITAEEFPEFPIPHDGWKSRKVIIGCTVLGLVFVGGAAAVVGGYATFDQVANLVKWAIPSVLLPQMAGLGLDKIAQARRG